MAEKEADNHNVLLDAPERPHEAIPAENEEDKRIHRLAWAKLRSKWQRFKYDLFQQQLPATIWVVTPTNALSFLVIVGIVCLSYGIALLVGSLQITSYSYDYTDAASGASTISIPISTDMSSNTFIYIKFENVYLNTKTYTTSLDRSQLEDGLIAAGSSDCSPWEESYYPCGLIAASAFTDTFVFRLTRDSTTTFLDIDESADTIVAKIGPETKNPSTVSDVDFWIVPYFPPTICRATSPTVATPAFTVNEVSSGSGTRPDCTSTSCNFTPTCSGGYAEVTNPAGWGLANSHFTNWMSTPATPFFSKLWAKVDESLYAGDEILVDVNNRWSAGTGKKIIEISEINWQGGRSPFLGAGLIAVGSAYLIGALVIFVLWRKNPRKLGDHDTFKFASTIKHKNE